jgi:DNA-binding transcriptional ArsR family regulator
MSVADLGRTKFAYSPLVEIAESLYLLAAGHVPVLHQDWLAAVRSELHRTDLELLTAVVPARPFVADFFFRGTHDRSTAIEQQLHLLATTPVDALRRDLEAVWRDEALPRPVQHLLADPSCGPRRLADALREYWQVALAPHWPSMRSALDDDVAYRAAELTKRGLEGLLGEMHPELSVIDNVLRIQKKRHPGHHENHDLVGTGMLLIPSIFVWPNVLFAADPTGPATLIYPARGVGNVWGGTRSSASADDALAALLGRSRAAVLASLSVPQSTTELALSLRQSPPAVSQHLSVLRRSALVASWRASHRVLYRRTALGDSIVEAISSMNLPGTTSA